MTGYTAKGQKAWGPNNQQVPSGGVGGGTFDVGQWTPNSVISWVPSLQNRLTLEVNGTAASSQVLQNLVDGSDITVTDEGAGNISIAYAGQSPPSFTSAPASLGNWEFLRGGYNVLSTAAGYFINTTANTVQVWMFQLPYTFAFNTLSTYLAGSGVAGTLLGIGVYSASGSRLIHWDSISGVGPGHDTTATPTGGSVTLAPGDYYWAMSCSKFGREWPVDRWWNYELQQQ